MRTLIIILLSLYSFAVGAKSPYWNLQLKLAQENQVSKPEISSLDSWLNFVASHCSIENQKNITQQVHCLIKQVYEDAAIQFDSTSQQSPRQLLPTSLLHSRKGDCLPISFLVLLLAERLEIQAVAISLPGHVFIQFPNGVNWEPNRKGYAYSLAEYHQKYLLDATKGRTAKSLTPQEFEGLVRFEMGNRFLNEQPKLALIQYQLALKQWNDPRISGNQALALVQLKEYAKAFHILDSLWKQKEISEELAWNRILVALQIQKPIPEVLFYLDESRVQGLWSPRLQALDAKLRNYSP